MRFKEIETGITSYLESCCRVATVDTYLYAIKRFLRVKPNAQYLQLAEIETYFLKLKVKGDCAEYRRVILSAIKLFYKYLVDEKIVEEHPCIRFFIKEKKKTGMDFNSLLTMNEMELLYELKETRYSILDSRDKVIIGLLIHQGMTSKELINLKVTDYENGKIFIQGNKKRRSRTIELKASQMVPLLKYLECDRPQLNKDGTNKLLISMRSGNGMTVDSVHAFISRMGGAFGKEMSPANIRKSVISYWLNERGIPMADVQIMAGHKYPSSTQKYIRPDIEEQRDIVNRLHDDIFG